MKWELFLCLYGLECNDQGFLRFFHKGKIFCEKEITEQEIASKVFGVFFTFDINNLQGFLTE